MTVASFIIPAVGLAVWIVHVAQSVSPYQRRWAFWVWLLGLPAAVVICFQYVRLFVPISTSNDIDDHSLAAWWTWAVFLGIAEWGILLVAEPFL